MLNIFSFFTNLFRNLLQWLSNLLKAPQTPKEINKAKSTTGAEVPTKSEVLTKPKNSAKPEQLPQQETPTEQEISPEKENSSKQETPLGVEQGELTQETDEASIQLFLRAPGELFSQWSLPISEKEKSLILQVYHGEECLTEKQIDDLEGSNHYFQVTPSSLPYTVVIFDRTSNQEVAKSLEVKTLPTTTGATAKEPVFVSISWEQDLSQQKETLAKWIEETSTPQSSSMPQENDIQFIQPQSISHDGSGRPQNKELAPSLVQINEPIDSTLPYQNRAKHPQI